MNKNESQDTMEHGLFNESAGGTLIGKTVRAISELSIFLGSKLVARQEFDTPTLVSPGDSFHFTYNHEGKAVRAKAIEIRIIPADD